MFFLQTLQGFNRKWPQLFGREHDDAGDDGDTGERSISDFDKYYGWIYNTKQVAEFEGVNLEQAFDLNIMQALNDLCYLKAKKNTMANINTAQRQLLAEGFLDRIGGNDFSDFVPKESMKALITLSGILIENAQKNLQQQGSVSSGALSDSFVVNDPKYIDSKISLDVMANFYYRFLNKGVRGTKRGSGQFAFKTSNPSQAMVKSIEKWISRSGLSSANVTKSVSSLESKNKTVGQFSKAYAVARSIKMKGIRATNFYDKAVQIAEGYARDVLGRALKVDIIDSLPEKLSEQKQA